MKDSTDKDKRIEFLEETVRRLLREKYEWQGKALELDKKLNALAGYEDVCREGQEKTSDFLNRVGELIRPLIHEIKGTLPFIDAVFRKINFIGENKSEHNEIANLLNSGTAAIQHLRRRITDLSYLGGKVPDLLTKVEVNDLIRENVSYIQNRYPNINIEVCVQDDPLEIYADKESLNQIVANLTINAIEACEASKGRVTITTRKKKENPHYIQIVVADNGIGIYPSEINKIYELHYTTKKTGFGIGLYLVKRAVDFHKGSINCESNPGRGTTFTVELPVTQGESS
jgi:signal transduction histidine kinase